MIADLHNFESLGVHTKQVAGQRRPLVAAGKTRRRVAAELIDDLERIHARNKVADKELRDLVAATGTSLLDLNGIGPSGAARHLAGVPQH